MDTREFTPELPALYVVATPIGNLSDLSHRASDVLRSVGLVAAEDTRVTGVLLRHLGAKADLLSLHAHNERSRIDRIVGHLQGGNSCALVSDAGTPAVSDPGARLVAGVRAAGHRVIPVPGPSAVLALLSAAGLDADRFGEAAGRWYFEGFLPARSAQRRRRLDELASLAAVLVLMESPHRIAACVADMAERLGSGRTLVIGRELTKRFEQIVEMPLGHASAWLQADTNHTRGEFVLALAPQPAAGARDGAGATTGTQPPLAADSAVSIACTAGGLMQHLLAELPPARAARIAHRLSGLPQAGFYALATRLRNDRDGPDRDGGD